jgi:hypothetical protein
MAKVFLQRITTDRYQFFGVPRAEVVLMRKARWEKQMVSEVCQGIEVHLASSTRGWPGVGVEMG